MNDVRSRLVRFSDSLTAGFPSPAEGYEDDPLNLHDWIVRNPAATFFYRVTGDDLAREYIRDGAILVVDRSVKATRGKLVIVETGGTFAVTRFVTDQPAMVVGVVVATVMRF